MCGRLCIVYNAHCLRHIYYYKYSYRTSARLDGILFMTMVPMVISWYAWIFGEREKKKCGTQCLTFYWITSNYAFKCVHIFFLLQISFWWSHEWIYSNRKKNDRKQQQTNKSNWASSWSRYIRKWTTNSKMMMREYKQMFLINDEIEFVERIESVMKKKM